MTTTTISSSPFLVVGASGPTGGEVAAALVRAGARVRASVRSEASGERARKSYGALEVAIADSAGHAGSRARRGRDGWRVLFQPSRRAR